MQRQVMNLARIGILALVFGPLGGVSAQTVHEVADGDGEGLRAALETAAASGGSSVIRLAVNGRYAVDSGIALVTAGEPAEIRLDARRSTLTLAETGSLNGFGIDIAEGVRLGISDATLRFQRGPLRVFASGMRVRGALELDRVTITGSSVATGLFDLAGDSVLDATNLSIIDNALPCRLVAFGGCITQNLFEVRDAAALTLRHATIDRNEDAADANGGTVHPVAFATGSPDAHIEVANSIIGQSCSRFLNQNPDLPLPISLGGNLIADPACEFAGEQDRVQPFELSALSRVFRSIPVADPGAGSPALGLGVDALCSAVDALGAPREAPCDAGAFERDPAYPTLAEGGWNGLWYNAESDGHYVSLMQSPRGDVVLQWTTFDADGNPAWIYAVGEVGADNVIVGDAYVNRGGAMTAAGVPTGQAPDAWGRFVLEFEDCRNGRFEYSTDDPTFPAEASFALNRLAFDGLFGCRDAE